MDRNVVERYRLGLFGRMVMGVAHEVDNHLSVVLGFSELIQLSAGKEQKVRDGAGKILSAGEKIGAIVQHFSRYVRPHAPSPEPFVAGELIPEILLFSRYDLGRDNVTVAPPPDVPRGNPACRPAGFRAGPPRPPVQRRGGHVGEGRGTLHAGVHRRCRMGVHGERPRARDSRGVRGEGLRGRVHDPHRTAPLGNGTPGRTAPRGAGWGNGAPGERRRGRVRGHDPHADKNPDLIASRRGSHP